MAGEVARSAFHVDFVLVLSVSIDFMYKGVWRLGNWEYGIGRQDTFERYQASSGHEFYYDSYDKKLWGAAPLSPEERGTLGDDQLTPSYTVLCNVRPPSILVSGLSEAPVFAAA